MPRVEDLLVGQLIRLGDVTERRHKYVPRVVRIQVHDHEGRTVAGQDQRFLVIALPGKRAQETAVWLVAGRLDVPHPPGSPEALHYGASGAASDSRPTPSTARVRFSRSMAA